MEQNPLTNPPRSDVIPEPKYRCSGKGCETGLVRRGYCAPCHRKWEVENREHRRAYARARTAGIKPPRKRTTSPAAARDRAGAIARAKVLAAYGAACSICGTITRSQLVLIPTAHDGQPTAPYTPGKPFYDKLERAGYPHSGLIGGRMHQIALRCKTCTRQPR
jgi:hypothetical protein